MYTNQTEPGTPRWVSSLPSSWAIYRRLSQGNPRLSQVCTFYRFLRQHPAPPVVYFCGPCPTYRTINRSLQTRVPTALYRAIPRNEKFPRPLQAHSDAQSKSPAISHISPNFVSQHFAIQRPICRGLPLVLTAADWRLFTDFAFYPTLGLPLRVELGMKWGAAPFPELGAAFSSRRSGRSRTSSNSGEFGIFRVLFQV